MKNWKRILALLLSLTMLAALCACKPEDAESSADPSAGPSASADPDASASPAIVADLTQDALSFSAGMSADDILLTVNGTDVHADLFLYMLAMDCSSVQMYLPLIGQTMDELAPDLLEDAVSMTASYILLQQKAAELGCLPTDAQVQEAQDALLADGQENYDTLKTAFGLTDGSLELMSLSNAYYDNLLEIIAPTATDEMLNSYAYQAKHILLKTVDTNAQQELQEDGSYAYPALPAETVAEKKKQAEDILAQIQAADDPIAKFDELMNEFSEDGRGEDGALAAPDGYTTTLGKMVPAFEQGALALEPGEISGLVESSYGYHIILRGEVEDIQSYADECRQHHVDQELSAMMDAADITRAAALDSLNVSDFFDKYVAYYSAVMEQNQPEDGGEDLDPVSSDGVG